MLPKPSAMAQDFFIMTSRFYQFVSEERKLVEGAVVVDGLGQGLHGQREPGGVDGDGVEGVAEDAAKAVTLNRSHCISGDHFRRIAHGKEIRRTF